MGGGMTPSHLFLWSFIKLSTDNREPWEHLKGLSVTVRNNDMNGALRILKKKVQRENLLRDLAEREHYTKPSMKRRMKQQQAVVRWKKKQAEIAESL
jgi:small subunit ribosomal protein S21